LSAADLGLTAEQVGLAGSRVETISVAPPASGAAARILEGDAKTAAATLVGLLQKEARVL
jgi:electron transfer flavoprotein alpha/beta subunit